MTPLEKHIQDIETSRNEATRRTLFVLFVNKVIGIGLVDTEDTVDVLDGKKTSRKRIDLRYGTLVMEFKTSLERHSEQAKKQLREYVSGLLNVERRDYVLVATDGIRFNVYNYQITSDSAPLQPCDIKLGLKNFIDVKQRLVGGETLEDELVIDKIRELVTQTELPKIPAKNAQLLFQPDHALYTGCIKILCSVNEAVYEVPFNEWKKYQDVVYGDFQRTSKDVQRMMFLNHTYMATVAKIITHALIMPNSKDSADDIIHGASFVRAGIGNFVEDDFFSWVTHDDSREVIDDIRCTANQIDSGTVNFDMLRSIYETIEEPKNRHLLGASYTPDWLAEKVLTNLIRRSGLKTPNILDPTCGSGTFLAIAIRLLRQNMQDHTTDEIIKTIQSSVFGVDIHPVAVLFSRANYIMAIRDLLKDRKTDMHIPVYMADMIDYPIAKESPLDGGKFYTFESGGVELHIPVHIEKSIDYIVDKIHDSAKSLANDTERAAVISGLHAELAPLDIPDNVLQYFDSTTTTLERLIRENKDSIHQKVEMCSLTPRCQA